MDNHSVLVGPFLLMLFIIALVVMVTGCAATVVKYDWCLGFCGSASIDKEEAPKQVIEAVKETVKAIKE